MHSMVTRPLSSWEGGVWARDYVLRLSPSTMLAVLGTRLYNCIHSSHSQTTFFVPTRQKVVLAWDYTHRGGILVLSSKTVFMGRAPGDKAIEQGCSLVLRWRHLVDWLIKNCCDKWIKNVQQIMFCKNLWTEIVPTTLAWQTVQIFTLHKSYKIYFNNVFSIC